jgi:pimeloyl-ACP methyl ester carboxylesterase
VHGFARDRQFHRDNARYIAKRGLIVMTPDLVSLLGGEASQKRNISDIVDHVAWLTSRSGTVGDVLEGRIDPSRIGLAGHSAGGAIVFEAAAQAQSPLATVNAVGLLDAVPWSRTLAQADAFPAIALASVRSESSPCNANGSVRSLLARLPFRVEDVRIVGATHCDPENPSDRLCDTICGASSPKRQRLYRTLMYLFLRDALAAPMFESDFPSYESALDAYQADGLLARTTVGQ